MKRRFLSLLSLLCLTAAAAGCRPFPVPSRFHPLTAGDYRFLRRAHRDGPDPSRLGIATR